MNEYSAKALRRSRKAIIQKSRKLASLMADTRPSEFTEAQVKQAAALERDLAGWLEIMRDAVAATRPNKLT